MPNYNKTLESYRCGDLFQDSDGTKYMLTQVEAGEFNLITLDDLSNRCTLKSNLDGSRSDRIYKKAFEEWSNDGCSLKLSLIGNISDFNLVQK